MAERTRDVHPVRLHRRRTSRGHRADHAAGTAVADGCVQVDWTPRQRVPGSASDRWIAGVVDLLDRTTSWFRPPGARGRVARGNESHIPHDVQVADERRPSAFWTVATY